MQTRPDRAGDSYSFAWEHEVRRSAGGHVVARSTREDFRIDLQQVRPDGLRLVRTRTASDLGGSEVRTEDLAYTHAWIGVPVVFEAELNGAPRRVVNWPEVKAAVLANLKRTAPGDAYEDAKAYLDGVRPEEFAVQDIGSELYALSGVHYRGIVPAGLREFPARTGNGVKILQTANVSLQEPGRVRVERTTRSVPKRADGQTWDWKTTATVAADDGWMLDFETVAIEKRPDIGAEEVTTTRARRTAGPGDHAA